MTPELTQVKNLWRYSLTYLDAAGVEHTIHNWSLGLQELKSDLDAGMAVLSAYQPDSADYLVQQQGSAVAALLDFSVKNGPGVTFLSDGTTVQIGWMTAGVGGSLVQGEDLEETAREALRLLQAGPEAYDGGPWGAP
jgi:hypothetical protein